MATLTILILFVVFHLLNVILLEYSAWLTFISPLIFHKTSTLYSYISANKVCDKPKQLQNFHFSPQLGLDSEQGRLVSLNMLV